MENLAQISEIVDDINHRTAKRFRQNSVLLDQIKKFQIPLNPKNHESFREEIDLIFNVDKSVQEIHTNVKELLNKNPELFIDEYKKYQINRLDKLSNSINEDIFEHAIKLLEIVNEIYDTIAGQNRTNEESQLEDIVKQIGTDFYVVSKPKYFDFEDRIINILQFINGFLEIQLAGKYGNLDPYSHLILLEILNQTKENPDTEQNIFHSDLIKNLSENELRDIGLSLNDLGLFSYFHNDGRCKLSRQGSKLSNTLLRKFTGARKKIVPLNNPDYYYYVEIIRRISYFGQIVRENEKILKGVGEETITSYFLPVIKLVFNDLYSGLETYYKKGRTDFSVNRGIKTVFLGEAKIWNGPKTIKNGLNQLFKRYVSGGGKYTGLIIYNRDNVSFTDIVESAKSEMEDYHLFKKGGTKRFENTFAYEFLNPEDKNQVVNVELILFDFHLTS